MAHERSAARRASRSRRSIEPARFSAVQDQEVALAQARRHQQVQRKGEKRAATPSDMEPPRGSQKRARAEERRNARMARRRECLSPQTPLGEDGMLRPRRAVSTQLAMAAAVADDEDADGHDDALQRVAVHSTAWRRCYFPEAPPNRLTDEDLAGRLPFDMRDDRPLHSFHADGTADEISIESCAIMTPREMRTFALDHADCDEDEERAIPDAELESRVQARVDEVATRLRACHRARVKHLLQTSRSHVRAALKELPKARARCGILKDCVQPLEIPSMERTLTHKILHCPTFVKPVGVSHYVVGRSESMYSERRVTPHTTILLRRVAPVCRSTTCVSVRDTIPVGDDPIIRCVPIYEKTAKGDASASSFAGFADTKKVALSALDDEVNENVLRCVVKTFGGDPRVLTLLRELEIFRQPETDYAMLQRMQARGAYGVSAILDTDKHLKQELVATPSLRTRLSPSISVGCSKPLNDDKAADRILTSTQTLFCRRCLIFNCQRHGIAQPRASARTNPQYPAVKISRLLYPQYASQFSQPTQPEPDQSVDLIADDEDNEEIKKEANMRRSVRACTAASTKASAQVQVSSVKPRKRVSRPRFKMDPHADPSEYFDLLGEYRKLTDARRKTLLSSKEACGDQCAKLVSKEHRDELWSQFETRVVDFACRIVGPRSCVIAELLHFKSCAEIAALLKARSAQGHNLMLLEDRMPCATWIRDAPKWTQGNHQAHLVRTRFQRMKDRGANHQNVPCSHPQVSCNAAHCSCMNRDHFCDKGCACPADCANRFAGCRCAPGECGTLQCPCYFSNRECDPDICVSCGAADVPVLAMANASSSTNAVHKMCGNIQILRGQPKRIRVAPSDTHGWGAFAVDGIEEGAFIYEYTGELLSQDEAERRGSVYDRNTVSFLFDLNEDEVVDAARKGNKSKFANHSSEDPNCFARIVIVQGDHRIGLFAKREIAPGEELFFDYGYHGVVPDWSQGRISASSQMPGWAAPLSPPPPATPESVESVEGTKPAVEDVAISDDDTATLEDDEE